MDAASIDPEDGALDDGLDSLEEAPPGLVRVISARSLSCSGVREVLERSERTSKGIVRGCAPCARRARFGRRCSWSARATRHVVRPGGQVRCAQRDPFDVHFRWPTWPATRPLTSPVRPRPRANVAEGIRKKRNDPTPARNSWHAAPVTEIRVDPPDIAATCLHPLEDAVRSEPDHHLVVVPGLALRSAKASDLPWSYGRELRIVGKVGDQAEQLGRPTATPVVDVDVLEQSVRARAVDWD